MEIRDYIACEDLARAIITAVEHVRKRVRAVVITVIRIRGVEREVIGETVVRCGAAVFHGQVMVEIGERGAE